MGFRRRRWRPPTSIQQNRLLHAVRMGGWPQAQLNWPIPIRGMRKKRWADIGIVNLRICIEYQGQAYHNSPNAKERDKLRTNELEAMGWVVILVDKNNWKWFVANMHEIIKKAAKEKKSLYPSSTN